MPSFFLDAPWPGMACWTILYTSDYYLTLLCARLYRKGVSDKVSMQGSYEITPFYQADINALKVISPRFIAVLVGMNILLAVLWWSDSQSSPSEVVYQFVLGALIVTELAVHTRHFHNLHFFLGVRDDAVQGHIEFSRPLLLSMSAVQLVTFAALFMILFLFTRSWFILGGAVSCLWTGCAHALYARRAKLVPNPQREGPPISSETTV